jgi:hypothetical protein
LDCGTEIVVRSTWTPAATNVRQRRIFDAGSSRRRETRAKVLRQPAGRTLILSGLMEDTWALGAIRWLLTPALITGGLIGLARLYDPPTRWARRLKSDMAIASGLPEGPEKVQWQLGLAERAQRIREYRIAFVGWTRVVKWIMVVFVGGTLVGLIVYPPINKPGDRYPYSPAEYPLIFGGIGVCLLYMYCIGAGTDFIGRNARELILLRRLRRYHRRARRLRRLGNARAKATGTGSGTMRSPSRLGFESQVDPLGAFMQHLDLRLWILSAGFVAADHHASHAARLRDRGVPIPPWPAYEDSNAPTTDRTRRSTALGRPNPPTPHI